MIDPAEYRVVPEHTVGRFEHPVILRLEVEKFRRDVLGLQHLEHRQALATIDAVVVAAVDDEHRGAEASLGRNLRSGSHDSVPVCPRAAIRGPAFPTPGLRLLLVGFVEALKTRNAPQCRLCAAAGVACCVWTIGNAKIIKPDRQSLWVYPQSRAVEQKGIASRKQGDPKKCAHAGPSRPWSLAWQCRSPCDRMLPQHKVRRATEPGQAALRPSKRWSSPAPRSRASAPKRLCRCRY